MDGGVGMTKRRNVGKMRSASEGVAVFCSLACASGLYFLSRGVVGLMVVLNGDLYIVEENKYW